MEILKFKTNLTDEVQVAKAAPFIDKLEGIKTWKVDTESQEKILSIAAKDLDPQKVESALEEAGFSAIMLRVIGISGEDL